MSFSPFIREPFDIEAHKERYAAPTSLFERIGRAATATTKRFVNQDKSVSAYPEAANRKLMRRIGVGVTGVAAVATLFTGLHAKELYEGAGRVVDAVEGALPGDNNDDVERNLETFGDCTASLTDIPNPEVVAQKTAECQDQAFGDGGN